MQISPVPAPVLAVRRRDAARILGLSERTIWSLTDSGELPCIRIGKSVRYATATLADFISKREGAAQ